MTYNLTMAEGSRVTSVKIGSDNDDLDPDMKYQVTTSKYLADGGDGYDVSSKALF